MKCSRMVWSVLVLAGMALPMSGCSVFDDDDDDDRTPAQVQTKDELPDDVKQVAAATGQDVNWRAEQAGRIYVLDRNTNKVLYTGKVKAEQRVKIDISRGRVTVGDDTVLERKLASDREYRIYFLEK